MCLSFFFLIETQNDQIGGFFRENKGTMISKISLKYNLELFIINEL